MALPQIALGERSGLTIPRVNIGAMRLPQDVDEAIALLRYAIDSGMRYIDTSRGYGDSEIVIGKALKDGYRDKVILSTKWSPYIIKPDPKVDTSADCVRRRIDEQMQRLDVGYLDFYQLWNIMNPEQYAAMTKKGGMLEGILKAMDEGLVGHTGCTTHDTPENVLSRLDEMEWCEVLLLTYNVMNGEYAEVFKKAHALGIGTLVMNPVGGGTLTEDSPLFKDIITQTGSRDLPDLAVRYIHANTYITTTISGISKKSDVDAIIATAHQPLLSSEEYTAVVDVFTRLQVAHLNFCTGCSYCMPCPHGVNIPSIMDAIHYHRHLGMQETAKNKYAGIGTSPWIKGNNADACIACGECTPKCTQKLDIPNEMEAARDIFN